MNRSSASKIVLALYGAILLCTSSNSTAYAVEVPVVIESVNYSIDGEALRTLEGIDQEVYATNIDSTLDIQIGGRITGLISEKSVLTAVILPSLKQYPIPLDEKDPEHFKTTIKLDELVFDQPYQVMIFDHLDTEEIASEPVVVNFTLKNKSNYPSLKNIFVKAARSSTVLIFLFALFLGTLIVVLITMRKLSGGSRIAAISLTFILLIVLSVEAANQVMIQLVERGVIVSSEETLRIQTKFPNDAPLLSLTRLNENLEVEPSLSSSWSNISPKIWEFTLRSGSQMTAESIITSIKRLMSNAESPYLSSLEGLVSVNDDRIQFITKFPDPLLPQKLTKVEFATGLGSGVSGNLTDEYISKVEIPGEIRSIRNMNYSGLPFLSESALFKTELITNDTEALKKIVVQETIDLFDEPDPSLWPTLSQHGYQIEPKINTKSAFVLINRNSPDLKSATLIAALKKIMNSTRILQTSYFQYGRLANQFAPPGVVGYDPGIEIPVEQRSIEELVEQALRELGKDVIVLKFKFPEEEKVLAKVIMKELERSGVETTISDSEPDLELLVLDFNLGDVGPFLDGLIDSHSPLNHTYKNEEADRLIAESRSELNSFNRLKLLQQIMKIIVIDDPAGIPLLFKKSFIAKKIPEPLSWYEKWLKYLMSKPSNTSRLVDTQKE